MPKSCAAKIREMARPRSSWDTRAATAEREATSMAPADAPCRARDRANQAACSGKT